jgi:hypothetical protein
MKRYLCALFMMCGFPLSSFAGKQSPEDQMRKAIIRSDAATVRKLITPGDLEKASALLETAEETRQELLELAQQMEGFRDEKAKIGSNAHLARILQGAGLIAIGVIKGIFDLVYRTDETTEGIQGPGLYATDLATDVAITAYGGYYVYVGAMKKDPSKQLANAAQIVKALSQLKIVKPEEDGKEEATQEGSDKDETDEK